MLSYLLSFSDERNAGKIEYIFEKYYKDMLRFAMSRFKRIGCSNYQTEAEDAVQNAFVKITIYIDRINFDVSEKELKTYVLTIVSNEVANIVSDKKRIEVLDEEFQEFNENAFFEKLHIQQRYEKVVEEIGKLDERYSITLLYRYQKEMTVADIADLMGVSEKTVYTRLQRGRALLLKALGGEY